MVFTRIEGRQTAQIRLYTLSTCAWCRKAKSLLDELGLAYEFVDVDKLDEDVKKQIRQDVSEWNPRCSFPTMIINDVECVIGFKEERIRELARV